MPWLAGAALLHSQAVTEKRGSFRGWTLLLAIATFSLSLLGTFLVRSGVLTSVHAFAADPSRSCDDGLVGGGSGDPPGRPDAGIRWGRVVLFGWACRIARS